MRGFFKNVSDMNTRLASLPSNKRRELISLCAGVFLILFSYPFIRIPSEALFINAYGATKSPYVWILSVTLLAMAIGLYNQFSKRFRLTSLFRASSIAFAILISLSVLFLLQGNHYFAYVLFILKEIYVVLLLHMVYLMINTHIDLELAKIVFGPLGAIGSLGGIIGGVIVSQLANQIQPEYLIFFGVALFVFSSLILGEEIGQRTAAIESKFDKKPLAAIGDVKLQVFLILALVMLSQFAVNIVQFKFNFYLEDHFTDKMSKTQFLANIYTWVNGLSFLIQVVAIPYLVRTFSLNKLHSSIPIFYFLMATLPLAIPSLSLFLVALFVGSKALDYSLFATAKELLYFDLNSEQKYGAKYLVDMVGYRLAKGLISFVLIFVQSSSAVNLLLFISLVLWGGSIWALALVHKKGQISGEINEQSITE